MNCHDFLCSCERCCFSAPVVKYDTRVTVRHASRRQHAKERQQRRRRPGGRDDECHEVRASGYIAVPRIRQWLQRRRWSRFVGRFQSIASPKANDAPVSPVVYAPLPPLHPGAETSSDRCEGRPAAATSETRGWAAGLSASSSSSSSLHPLTAAASASSATAPPALPPARPPYAASVAPPLSPPPRRTDAPTVRFPRPRRAHLLSV